MDINSSTMATREINLNRANTEQDILSKTLVKAEEGEQTRKAAEPKAPEGPKSSKQGRIDLYA